MQTFLEKHWPDQPLHLPSVDPQRNVDLLGVPELRDFRSLAPRWPLEVLVLPKASGDETQGAMLKSPAALEKYENGHPIFLHRPNRAFPRLNSWIRQLKYDLGIAPWTKFVCSSHGTIGGTDTNMHFDHSPSFVLQMSGEKVWQIAPNRSVPMPTTRYSLSMPRLHGELASYLEEPLPTAMPSDTVEVVLKPGSLLYVPSGWWHAVKGTGESFALMFIVINVNWADVFSFYIRRKLAQDPAWRRFAVGGRSRNPQFRARALEEFEPLLRGVLATIEQIRAEDVLEPRYFHDPEVSRELEGSELRLKSPRWSSKIEFGEPEQLALFEAIDAHGKAFTASEFVARGFAPDDVEEVISALMDVEYIHVE